MTTVAACTRAAGSVVVWIALLTGICAFASVSPQDPRRAVIPVQLSLTGKGPRNPPTPGRRMSPPAKPAAGSASGDQRLADAIGRLTPKERKRLAKAMKRLSPQERKQLAELVKRQLAGQGTASPVISRPR